MVTNVYVLTDTFYTITLPVNNDDVLLGLQGNGKYDAVVKFDMYRNLQRHRVVLFAKVRLSYFV